jgi:hypothetical protein
MNQIHLSIMLLALSAVPIRAQRMDGCPAREGSSFSVSSGLLDYGLQRSGVNSTREALTLALEDPRPEIRSLAALKLAHTSWTKADLAALMRAWLSETDTCTKDRMDFALQIIMPGVVYDPTQHPGHQPWVTPFQACTASEPPVLTLAAEQANGLGVTGPAVRLSLRNQTQQAVAFVGAPTEELFSVTVLRPSGAPAAVLKGVEWMFEPSSKSHKPQVGREPTFAPIPPQGVSSWIWNVGNTFDMSEPGVYHVSLGGRITYLDTTICSNMAEVKVGN